jgi:NAD(P)-dependent dehydrogenase (short-subunit alcohol dehydrogenase family)
MYNPFSLEGKTILVTGASSGIGRATAIECSKMGAKLFITARNEERLRETLSQMEGTEHSIIAADLSEEQGYNKIVEDISLINGIVHCAGVIKTLPFSFIKSESLNSVMNINFTAPTLLTIGLLKSKKIAKNGSIVFISSIAGIWCVTPANAIYSATKGAVNGMTKSMALELAAKGIRVNSVNPGMIETNIFASGTITDEQFQEDMEKYPLKRYGKPEEVAYAVIYLLSDASRWITGSNLVIDGGYTLL